MAVTLEIGTRIYYGGDMANLEGFGEIVDAKANAYCDDVRVRMDDGRDLWVPRVMFSEAYAGHGGTRFVTEAAYRAWRLRRLRECGYGSAVPQAEPAEAAQAEEPQEPQVPPYRTDRRAMAARGAFASHLAGGEAFRALDAEVCQRVGHPGMTQAEAMAAVDAMDEVTFRRLTRDVPRTYWESGAVEAAPAPLREAADAIAPVPTDDPPADTYPTDRAEVIARIKRGLRQRSGRAWSVTGGRGTGYGWITIRATKKYAANQWGDLTDADQVLLAKLLGLIFPVHHQGVSIPAGHAYYREYIDRAEGRPPSVCGKPYWD